MSLSQYILDAREQYRMEVRQRNTWLTRLRWYYLFILAAVTTITSLLTNDNTQHVRTIAITTACIGLTLNLVLWALTKFKNQTLLYYHTVAVLQLILDVALASIVIYYQHGLASRATVLYAIPIAAAGLLFTQSLSYITAVLSATGYTIALILYRYNTPDAYELRQITLPAIFYGVVFIIIAIIVSAYRRRTASNEREKSYAELLAMMRHQLYHPSGVVSAIIDMLEHGAYYSKWPAKDKSYLQQLKRENKRIHTMITNMLESVTDNDTELAKTEVLNIIKLLNEEAVSCATGAKRITDLDTQFPHKVIEVEGDQEQLRAAMDNVISNAFHYTEVGTPVIISVSENNNKVTISIHDKGKGISEDEQHALFMLFSKMESRISGNPEKLYDTGLGLYVSKLIIERHKGTLELSSSAEYGTNIVITLCKRLP